MNRAVNNLALSLSEIPIKTFVKRSGIVPVPEGKHYKFNLGFDGNEAKLSYEEILALKSQKKPLPQNYNVEQDKREAKPIKDRSDKKSISVNKLLKAVELGDKGFVFKYIDSENINVRDQFGWTPLMSAAYAGHVAIVDFLLKLNADVKAHDKSGLTAIDLAYKKNYIEIIDLIKQKSHKSKKKTIKNNKVSNDNQSKKNIKQEKLYCDICKNYFTESSVAKHESSTLHIFNTNPKVRNICYGIPKCNRGYQMLLNRGWDEEGGLGPSGKGQKYPVKTILKRDRKGLGESEQKVARVTHFNPGDVNAVKRVYQHKRKSFTRRDRHKQLSKEAEKTRALRQALS